MAEHMLLLSAESPTGAKHYIAAAFPSACGKTNFAMLIPPAHYAGWKIRTIGDGHRLDAARPGRPAVGGQPRERLLRRHSRHNARTNPNAMATIARDTIYTNVATLDDGTVWWEGKDGPPPAGCIDWQGHRWTPNLGTKAAHPNSRFTSPMSNNPVLAPEADDGRGVPISPSSSAVVAGTPCRSFTSRATGRTACSWVRPWPARQPPPRRGRSGRCGAIRWRCCPSAATTWVIISRTGSKWVRNSPGHR